MKNVDTHAAVAVKISTLDVVPSVSHISPIANIAVNAAMTPSSSLVEFRFARTAMATVGRRQANTVATPEVKRNILLWVYMLRPWLRDLAPVFEFCSGGPKGFLLKHDVAEKNILEMWPSLFSFSEMFSFRVKK
jgi:hypothetical protein